MIHTQAPFRFFLLDRQLVENKNVGRVSSKNIEQTVKIWSSGGHIDRYVISMVLHFDDITCVCEQSRCEIAKCRPV